MERSEEWQRLLMVWAQDLFSYDIIPPSFTVFRPDESEVNARNIFASVADLPTVSEFVRAANHRNHLRTLSAKTTTLSFCRRCFTRQNSKAADIFLCIRLRMCQSAC